MKNFSSVLALVALLLICGCSSVSMPNGKYSSTIAGREDFAVIYGDHIHFWLRNPKINEEKKDYFEWAGKFKIGDDKRLIFDMDRQTARFMKFYFDVKMDGQSILVEDLMSEQTFRLMYHPAKARRGGNQNNSAQSGNGFQSENSTGVYR